MKSPESITKSRRSTKPPAEVDAPSSGSIQKSENSDGSSLTKMLSILRLFTPDQPVWPTTRILEELDTSRSTGYRYIKALHSEGILAAVGNGLYMLGPRIIELDLLIRNTDPLHRAGKGVLEALVSTTGQSALICMLFANSVLCVRTELAPLSPDRLFSRGQRRPFFRGAASKIILAHLPHHRLRSIYSKNTDAIHAAQLGTDWKEFLRTLSRIRKDGIAKSHGEYIPGTVGIAAPIFSPDKEILGSVGVSIIDDELKHIDVDAIMIAVTRAAREISNRVSEMTPQLIYPPRAVGS